MALREQDSDYNPQVQLEIAVACDMRLSSPLLKDNLIRGLVTAGAKVIDLGMVATPTFILPWEKIITLEALLFPLLIIQKNGMVLKWCVVVADQ